MTRKGVGPWTTREVAEANLFERDLLGPPPRGHWGRSGIAFRPPTAGESESHSAARAFDLFDEIGRARPHVPRALPSPVLQSRGSTAVEELLPAIAPEDLEGVAAPAPAAPFPTNCTTLSVFRRVRLEAESRTTVTPVTATRPPVNVITRRLRASRTSTRSSCPRCARWDRRRS